MYADINPNISESIVYQKNIEQWKTQAILKNGLSMPFLIDWEVSPKTSTIPNEKIEKPNKVEEVEKIEKPNKVEEPEKIEKPAKVEEPKSNEVRISSRYGISTKGMLTLQTYIGGKIQKNGRWVNATKDEIEKHLLPTPQNIENYRFQFLNLEAMANISTADAKEYLSNKGILSGKEDTFIAAAKQYKINEVYLMAHACLETGNGTSQLATGVVYNGTVVYNMFGIKAYDSNPITKGSEYAYQMGWTTPEKAIIGGAKFISENYINNDVYKQDTLYEMRWNPACPGKHQYATDVSWAIAQARIMEQIYKKFNNPKLTFDIPIYRG